MSKPYNHFSNAAANTHSAFVDTLCAIHNARNPAKAVMSGNTLARDFIYAVQCYQVELRYAYLDSDTPAALRCAYDRARNPSHAAPLNGIIPDLLRNRVQAELALLQGREQGLKTLDQMIEAGCRYMRTRPDLALTLDLPLPEKLWNQVRRSFTL